MSNLTISIIQTDLHWENKAANLAQLQTKIESLCGKTQVVVLPEMFSTGFSMEPAPLAESMEGPTVAWMKRMANENKIILTGSLIIRESLPKAEGKMEEKFYNRLIWMLPTGQLGYYDKRHRFAFAGEDQSYAPGEKRLIASVNGWKINVQICYDLRFPVWSRQSGTLPQNNLETPEYDVLINVANWPQRRSHAWKTLLTARAIENQCYVVGVNRVGNDGHQIYHSGDSMVVDPLGEPLFQQADAETIFTITLNREHLNQVREKFPFWKDADSFTLG